MVQGGTLGAKILIVDDNKGILEEATEYLQRRGYGVVAASNGVEALAALKANRDLRLLFSDIIMPGQPTGRALAETARQLHPGIKVLLTSGYTGGTKVPDNTELADAEFLAKPYRMRELAQKIEEVLNLPS